MEDLIQLEQIVVALIAFGLDIIPKVRVWWDARNSAQKQAIIIVGVFVAALVSAGIRCYRGICPVDWVDLSLEIAQAVLINFLVANGTHYGTRKITERKNG